MDPNENIRNKQDNLPSTKIDAQDELITLAGGDNTEEMLQNPRSDNTVQDVEDRSRDNHVQSVENPNGHINMEDVTDNPCCQTKSQNSVEDNNFEDQTSHLVSDSHVKDQSEIATGAIAQNQSKNTNGKVETDISNRATCSQNGIQSSSSHRVDQTRQNTLREILKCGNTGVNEEITSSVENARLNGNTPHSSIRDIFDDLSQLWKKLFETFMCQWVHFQQLLERDRPFLKLSTAPMHANLSRENERSRQYYSNRLTVMSHLLSWIRSIYRRLTTLRSNYEDGICEDSRVLVNSLEGISRELRYFCLELRKNEDDPPPLGKRDETVSESIILPCFLISILVPLILLYSFTILSYTVRQHFRR